MEFLSGLVVGWFTAPYALIGTILFFSGFPILFWGFDIYDDYRWKYGFGRTVILMVFSAILLHFFTPFDALSLFSGGFWAAALNLWLYALAYVGVGIVFSFIRFFFYAREFNKRRAALLGDNPSKEDKLRAYKARLSGFGSRLSLILKWIFHWPWSLLAWIFTDLLASLFDLVIDGGRAIFGRGYGAIARMNEPQWMKDMEREEKEALKASKAKG